MLIWVNISAHFQVTGSNKGIGLAVVRGLCKKFNGDVLLTGELFLFYFCGSGVFASSMECLSNR